MWEIGESSVTTGSKRGLQLTFGLLTLLRWKIGIARLPPLVTTSLFMSDLYILYGSQTGNADEISREIFDKCVEMGIPCKRESLNAAKGVKLKEVAKCVLVVCSTTGNGDAPENADGYWRSIKLRSAAKDLLAGIKYAVLGLGDTNYDKFCYMGKSIDKRFSELGAERFLEVHCADEAVGLEDVVNVFRAKVFAALPGLMAATEAADSAASKDSAASIEVKGVESLSIASLEAEASAAVAASAETAAVAAAVAAAAVAGPSELQREALLLEAENFGIPTALPTGVSSFTDVAQACGLREAVALPPSDANLPKPKDEVSGVRIVVEATSEQKTSCSASEMPPDGWSQARPYSARLHSAHWLTRDAPLIEGRSGENCVEWGSSRRVVHMEVLLGDSGIKYDPGDSIGIFAPNPEYLVLAVLERLREQLASKQDPCAASLSLESLVALDDKRNDMISMQELLSFRLDLVAIPKKAAVLALSRHCSSSDEAAALRWLCSKCAVGKQLWAQFVEGQGLGIAELLLLFPSCCPPLAVLASVVMPMLPRAYSIASSPLMRKSSVTIAFSIDHFTCAEGRIRRAGLCTSYLEKLLSPWLYPALALSSSSSAPAPAVVRIFKRASVSFQLPGSCGHPLILIGPGTGVAPFIGFLEHRTHATNPVLRKSPSAEASSGEWRGLELDENDLKPERNHVEEFIHSVPPGPVHLFYGCRGEQDWIYRDFVQECLSKQTLTTFEIAFSRAQADKLYVTHKLLARATEIARLLLEENAYVYVCGDGNSMGKDVYSAVRQCLVDGTRTAERALDEAAADECLQEMKLRRRYILEVWS